MRPRTLLVPLALVALAAPAAWLWVTRPNLPAAERGRRLAEPHSFFTCHGSGGKEGAANPGRRERTVPTFGGDLMMYADEAADVRQWILDGVTERRRESKTWRAQREAGAVRMPAYRGALSDRQVDDLVAYVMLVSRSPEPEDSLALAGRDRAAALGCVGCHGPGGRLAQPNRGSLKGYVPSWDGADFPELVRDEEEFRQWVRNGVSDRFKRDRIASWFLSRARLRMPAYERHLTEGDLAALWAYVRWARSPAAIPAGAPVTSH